MTREQRNAASRLVDIARAACRENNGSPIDGSGGGILSVDVATADLLDVDSRYDDSLRLLGMRAAERFGRAARFDFAEAMYVVTIACNEVTE